jgi:hypothetical protein
MRVTDEQVLGVFYSEVRVTDEQVLGVFYSKVRDTLTMGF